MIIYVQFAFFIHFHIAIIGFYVKLCPVSGSHLGFYISFKNSN